MDKLTKGRIISALRRVSWQYAPRNERKKRQKRDKALYECEKCSKLLYEGKSQKTYKEYLEKYPNRLVEMDKPQCDHIQCVVPIIKNWEWSWDQFIANLFCGIEGYQILCTQCHKSKSDQENQQRKELRKLDK